VAAAVDAEAHPGDRHLEPEAGMIERRLHIGRQPVELDRPLHQAPDAEQCNEDHHGGERGEPAQHVMRAAADMARRPAVEMQAPARARRRNCAPLATGLTRVGRRQNVARLVR
jgi:hypothetical protein